MNNGDKVIFKSYLQGTEYDICNLHPQMQMWMISSFVMIKHNPHLYPIYFKYNRKLFIV